MRSTPSPFHFQITNPNDSLQGYSSGRNILETSVPHGNNYLSVQHDARLKRNWQFVVKGLLWLTDGSKMERGNGAGIYGQSVGRGLSFTLGRYATVFQV